MKALERRPDLQIVFDYQTMGQVKKSTQPTSVPVPDVRGHRQTSRRTTTEWLGSVQLSLLRQATQKELRQTLYLRSRDVTSATNRRNNVVLFGNIDDRSAFSRTAGGFFSELYFKSSGATALNSVFDIGVPKAREFRCMQLSRDCVAKFKVFLVLRGSEITAV